MQCSYLARPEVTKHQYKLIISLILLIHLSASARLLFHVTVLICYLGQNQDSEAHRTRNKGSEVCVPEAQHLSLPCCNRQGSDGDCSRHPISLSIKSLHCPGLLWGAQGVFWN